MNSVLAQIKKSGRYEYKHIVALFFGALLPLLFGGSVGPEAGLTGVIAGFCTWVGDKLRAVGVVMRQPVMCVLLLFLVFPLQSVIVLFAAAALASIVPVPRQWQK